MSHYAAVAAVRIQSWIARTPELRYVRGASAALSVDTTTTVLQATVTLPPGVRFADDAPEIDGVCVVEAPSVELADEAVENLLSHLSARLPGVEWTAWRVEAPSYVQAYARVHGSSNADVRVFPRRLPLSLDVPFLTPCTGCAHEAGVHSVHKRMEPGQPAEQESIGPDCFRRHEAKVRSVFDDFDDLARVGALACTVGRRDAANHLATVCADGNRVGGFFEAVAKLGDVALQKRLSSALDQAIHAAAYAAEQIGPPTSEAPQGTPVAITHFVGGDDVFASVAAPFAWRYAAVLGTTFDSCFADQVAQSFDESSDSEPELRQAVRDAAGQVSLGIGIAFANLAYPIADCRESALACERAAKRATRGREAAISWIDHTVEPPATTQPPPAGRFVTLEKLARQLGADASTSDSEIAVLTMDSSPRATLVALLRQSDGDTPQKVIERVRAWGLRTDHLETFASLLPAPEDADATEQLEALRYLVDQARWWPSKMAASASASATHAESEKPR